MRFCDLDGRLDFNQKGAPGSQPAELLPWFDHPDRLAEDEQIIFGHWSTVGQVDKDNIYPIDTGCVWGGSLTAFAIEDRQFIRCPC